VWLLPLLGRIVKWRYLRRAPLLGRIVKWRYFQRAR
jgi:hypothetical protein